MNQSRKICFVLFMCLGILVPLVVWAAVLTIDPSKGCVGTLVQITGSAWLEPQPVCHYRFLFDHPNPGQFKEDIAPRQPDGLFGPPNSSFTVPNDSKPGPHKVRVQLFLDSGEFLQQEQQPFTVIGVEYQGKTDCSVLDSGFDDTNATSNPPWLSVAVGQTTKVGKARIIPPGQAKEVGFKSSNTGTASVSPATASTSPQVLSVKGVAVGETTIEAFTGMDVMCESLNVAVYQKRTVTVAAFVITPTKRPGHPAAGCPKPNPNISKAGLQKALNNIWDQAAIGFTVTKLEKKTVDFDMNENCILDAGTSTSLGPEEQAIVNAAKDLNADINIYYVDDYSIDNASTLSKLTFIQDSHANMTENITAHEVGHSLGLPDVADTSRLMLESSSAANPCFLNKPEWDTSNTVAGTF